LSWRRERLPRNGYRSVPDLNAEPDSHAVLWDLEKLREARGLTNWMFEQFEPSVGGRVLEIGAGIGTFSELLLARPVTEVTLMEPYLPCVEVLRGEFGDRPGVAIVQEALPDSPYLAQARDSLDFILCQNVLEHVEDHAAALDAIAHGLRPGGCLGLLVPAHPRLFGKLDETYGHYRRYTRPMLRDLIERAGLQIDDLYSFNALGIPGWWVQSRRGTAELSSRALSAYELLLHAWKPLEARVRPPWGLSLIVRARKPS
jgi:SAM-dependent methyltransferase